MNATKLTATNKNSGKRIMIQLILTNSQHVTNTFLSTVNTQTLQYLLKHGILLDSPSHLSKRFFSDRLCFIHSSFGAEGGF